MAYEVKADIQRDATQAIVSVTVPDLSGSYATQTALASTNAAVTQAQADASQGIADAAAASNAASNAQATADGKIVTFYQATAPTAAAVGDLWVRSSDRQLFRWDGTTWGTMQDTGIGQALTDASNAQATADGKITTFYNTAPPTAEGVGDLWVDTDDNNHLYRWSGTAWVSVRDATIAQAQADASTAITNAATAQATADGKVTTFFQTGPPTAEGVGDLWLDTDDGNKLYRWSGSAWVVVQDAAIQTAITNAATAQSTADGKIVSFYQTTAPTAKAVGDFWIDTDDSNKLYRWSGSAWVVVRDATIDTKVPSIGSGTGVGKSFRYPLVYSSSTSSITDNLVIDTPITFGAFMCKLQIGGYNYSSTNNINLGVSFYAYNVGPAFVNTGAISTGNKVVTVRLARKISTGTVSVILTPSSGAWQYPKLTVSEALVTLSTPPDTFLNGWAVTQVAEASVAASYDLITSPPSRDVLSEVSSAQSAASGAQSTADGKNTVFYAATAPTAKAVNDLWFETDNGNKPYRWDGSTWVAQPLGDAAIANLDAGKITAGILQGVVVRTANTGAYVTLEPGTYGSDRIAFPSGTTGETVPAFIQTYSDGSAQPALSIYPGSLVNPSTNAGLTLNEGLAIFGSEDAGGETWITATTKVRIDAASSTVAEFYPNGITSNTMRIQGTALTGTLVTTTSTTFQTYTAGPSIVFNAPQSGIVKIDGLCYSASSVAGSFTEIAAFLRTGNSMTAGTVVTNEVLTVTANTNFFRATGSCLFTGLTPGSQYIVYLAYRTGTAGNTASCSTARLILTPSP